MQVLKCRQHNNLPKYICVSEQCNINCLICDLPNCRNIHIHNGQTKFITYELFSHRFNIEILQFETQISQRVQSQYNKMIDIYMQIIQMIKMEKKQVLAIGQKIIKIHMKQIQKFNGAEFANLNKEIVQGTFIQKLIMKQDTQINKLFQKYSKVEQILNKNDAKDILNLSNVLTILRIIQYLKFIISQVIGKQGNYQSQSKQQQVHQRSEQFIRVTMYRENIIMYSQNKIESNQIQEIQVFNSDIFKNLRGLYLDNNFIKNIAVFKSFHLQKLTDLDLSNNLIETLQQISLPNLISFNLQSNRIDSLEGMERWHIPSLNTLNLSNNIIRDISILSKCDMRELICLSLGDNLIETIQNIQRIYLPNLTSISLRKNQLFNKNQLIRGNFMYLQFFSVVQNNFVLNRDIIDIFILKKIILKEQQVLYEQRSNSSDDSDNWYEF